LILITVIIYDKDCYYEDSHCTLFSIILLLPLSQVTKSPSSGTGCNCLNERRQAAP
jgi:hypothetical protein